MNRQFAQGNLVSAATINSVKDGREALNFTVACNEGKDSKGNDIVEYVSVVAYGKTGFAKNLQEYLGKGAGVATFGKLVYSKSEKDGVVYTNPRVEVSGLYNIRLTGGKSVTAAEAQTHEVPAEAAQQAESAVAASVSNPAPEDGFDDDIPF